MKIGIIGTGHIGSSLIKKLSAAGHQVKVANSRGPDTIAPDLLVDGARPATVENAVEDVEVLILSIPMNRLGGIAPALTLLSSQTAVIDNSDYYPASTGLVDAIEAGQTEARWVQDQLGRPIVKAWNSVTAGTLANKGMKKGTSGRIALPVSADVHAHRQLGMALVEDTGFDAVDAGPIAEAWRHQPGAPAHDRSLPRRA